MNSAFGFGLPKFQFSLFFPFMAFFFLQSLLALTNPKQVCDEVFQCGNLTVGFPFWGDKRPWMCGHSDLELRCDHQTTWLQIQDVRYTLLHYNNTTQTLTLTRWYNLGVSLCSLPISNTTIDSSILEIPPGYKNLTVFYGCNVSSSDPYSFICADGETGLISTASSGRRSCARNTTFLVPEDFDDSSGKNILLRFKRVLKEGFEVKLKFDDKACRDCVASGGYCFFNYNNNQICGCNNSTGNSTNCRSQVFGLRQNTNNSVCGDCERSNGICGYDGRSNRFICFCADGPYELSCGSSKKVSLSSGKPFWRAKYVIGSSASLAAFISISIAFICYKFRKPKKATKRDLNSENVEALIAHKRYSYTQVKKMTKSFAHILGKGGFGIVYRGKLPDGRLVAVKVLTDSENTGEEFMNEVASMSKTSHMNIVSLHGFCFERSKRAIIYEFVQNGSLDKFISDKGSLRLDRKTLYDIALGVARGLEYLHNGCNTRIVHFDIKPQNILLDEEFCPKISDFGLAKLHEKKQSMISLLDARGTYRYIAPEVFSKTYGKPSHKSDVYSYGMLLLEMVGARNKEAVEPSGSNCSSAYFPDWIYKDLERRETARLAGDEINEEREEIVRKMTLVGLWCIQSSPLDRPAMSKVVEMMEGSIETLQIPPKPLLFCPAAAPLEECPSYAEQSSFSEKSQVAQAAAPLEECPSYVEQSSFSEKSLCSES